MAHKEQRARDGSAKPKKVRELMPGDTGDGVVALCMECGVPIAKKVPGTAGKQATTYCSKKCNKKYNARKRNRGAVIYDLALEMRQKRLPGAFGDLCHQISLFLQQDAADGRQTYIEHGGKNIPYMFPPADPINERAL